MDEFFDSMVRELIRLFGEAGETGAAVKASAPTPTKADSASAPAPAPASAPAPTKADTAPTKADKRKVITVGYTYTDETSDAKVIFPTVTDTHKAAEVSFALAYGLADVTLASVGYSMGKGEKEELANKILQVIARELVKKSLLGMA